LLLTQQRTLDIIVKKKKKKKKKKNIWFCIKYVYKIIEKERRIYRKHSRIKSNAVYSMPESRRAFCNKVSFTAANTKRI
jgi:hypothetical protein